MFSPSTPSAPISAIPSPMGPSILGRVHRAWVELYAVGNPVGTDPAVLSAFILIMTAMGAVRRMFDCGGCRRIYASKGG